MNEKATIALGLSLAVIMLGMGLSLTLKDFKRVAEKPFAILLGLFLQLVLLPAIAFGIALVLNLPDIIAVGLVILAACPGGPTSNLITHLAKGDTALSVSLTAVSSFITLLTIPFVINLGADVFMDQSQQVSLDVAETIKKILIVSIVPVILGMLINRFAPGFAKKMDKPVKIASAVILIVLIVGLVVKERANMADYFAQAGIATLLLNVISMSAGFFIAKAAKLNDAQATSVSIETGIQNGTMAITIAVGILHRTDLSIAAGVYSLIMFFTAGAVIFFMNRRNSKIEQE